jgi:predicted ATPase/class 3 adenylate cyclase/GAF domain-containing protein/tRNA A-37 threonylcarbamoyl transferase component Bud32
MLPLPGVVVKALIYESANSLVYRAIREQDSQPIILKLLKENYPTPQELARYRTEYEITKSLNLVGVVKAYDLQKYQNTLLMYLEDFGGESLREWKQKRKVSLEEFLQIAIAITDTLSQIHAANIIHKDLNPSNIVYNPTTAKIKLIDFGISTKLTKETLSIKNPNILEGTLAYMSPEQTGRMNRSLDYRSDFYSLGVTFYELLTNQLPFETNDALELVHCHLAKQPLPPSEINSKISQVISDIVIKLMAKTAEERYQSAFGIKADLESCLNQLQTNKIISSLHLGSQDINERFQLPQKLYGREQEIAILITAFERVATRSELMLIGGYSGIGKSVLVQELSKPITSKRGYFIAGKFDQYQRNIPYSAVVRAFHELVKQLLTETEAQLNQWREKLLEALGINGQVIVDVIPEIELIIGKQPAVPELGANESQNRFNLVFQNFIKVFTQPEHPLAIFLDDLQWADGASLKLMQLLMSGASKGLFLIGAYRDNEVSAAHHLMLSLEEISKSGSIINRITLSPLELVTIIQLISDTLKTSQERVRPLAELVQFKTGGNPFFLNEFLKSLYTEKLLKFDFETLSWQWNLALIQAKNFTDNVVEMMAGKIQKLSDNTQEILKLAACIGNQFDLKTLGLICSKVLGEIVNELQAAVAESLVVPVGNMGDVELAIAYTELGNSQSGILHSPLLEYKFVHDRIQQAAYSLIPDNTKLAVHQKIGQLLLKNTSPNKQEEKIFDIVNQLNFGTSLITAQSERYELAQLNLIAGKKAKLSAAYQPALNYLKVGIELLANNSWQQQYNLTLSLYEEAAEVAYLNTDFAVMDKLVEVVLSQTKTVLDKVKVYDVKIQSCTIQSKFNEAINIGLEALKLLGINLPKQPSNKDIIWGLLQTKLTIGLRSIVSLVNLPVMNDPYAKAAMRVLNTISTSTYQAAPLLFPLTVFQQVRLSLKWGNVSESAFSYSCYGLILCGFVGDIQSGYQFGQLALNLLNKLNAREVKARTELTVHCFIKHWIEPLKEIISPLREAYTVALETGDLQFANHAICASYTFASLSGYELVKLESEMSAQTDQVMGLIGDKVYHQAVLNLLGFAENPCNLIGTAFNEQEMLPILLDQNNRGTICYLYINKLMLCCLFGDSDNAIANADIAEQHLDSVLGSSSIPHFYFYDSLARLLVAMDAPEDKRKHLIPKVLRNQKKMRKWAKYSPMNNSQKYWLVQAEFCRLQGKDALAIEYYDKAIALAKENEYIHEAGIAYELAAKFYLFKGKELTAKAYMQQARYCYQLWGATAKVKHLEKQYPTVFTRTKEPIKSTTNSTSLTTTGSDPNLDIATVMKASQAISGEIVLDKLLSSLMKILIENAGAQKGYLILSEREKLLIEASGTIDDEQVTVLQSIPIVNFKSISEAIINYVARTQESVVLSDAIHEGKFTNDTYIQANQPKSILCVPLINQGKVVSIVYLENNLTTGAFTPERLEVLKLLSSQAAISIENAKLYTEVRENESRLAKLNQDLEQALETELKLTNTASRFVPNQFLSFLGYESLTEAKLGDAVQLEMSILFSDIRDFTTLSEKMTPEQNFKFINSYLSRMEPVITENNGFIDKYIGDAIMALFSGEADNAVKAGITMLHRLVEYNQHRTNSGYPPIQIGIGINTGSLILGTVGGENRMDGTVISDAVNLASRIESLTKNYGVAMLITQQTYERLKNPSQYAIRTIDTVQVKGKSQLVTVYEVFDGDLPAIKEGKFATLPTFTEALLLYNQGKLAEASGLFADCLRQNPGDVVAQSYLELCQKLSNGF